MEVLCSSVVNFWADTPENVKVCWIGGVTGVGTVVTGFGSAAVAIIAAGTAVSVVG